MKARKCCAHCPGKLIHSASTESHECCQPRYVSGNLRISCLERGVADCYRRKEAKEDAAGPLPENRFPRYDQFAVAKKLHAENLEHQPLPDRVDDSVLKRARPERSSRGFSAKKCCERWKEGTEGGRCSCSKKRYGPALGCKEPKSKMDLAICWETPLDPAYEPPKPSHVDGSEGGPAPAIFALVQRSSSSKSSARSDFAGPQETFAPCRSRESQESPSRSTNESKEKKKEKEKREQKSGRCCCDALCQGLSGVNISRKSKAKEDRGRAAGRRCVACEAKNRAEDPRLIRSAVGLALGTEKPGNAERRSGCKTAVARPRTPFARRSFRIDTLTPPFSVANGSRDGDFPEHWRLLSVYQQSYRNPYRRRVYRC